jgi:hypothetical protein
MIGGSVIVQFAVTKKDGPLPPPERTIWPKHNHQYMIVNKLTNKKFFRQRFSNCVLMLSLVVGSLGGEFG